MIAPARVVGPRAGPRCPPSAAPPGPSGAGRARRAAAALLAAVLLGGCSAGVTQPTFPVNDPGLVADLDRQAPIDLRDPATNATLTLPSVSGFWDSTAQRAATSPGTVPQGADLAAPAPGEPAPDPTTAGSTSGSVLSIVSPSTPSRDVAADYASPPGVPGSAPAAAPSDAPLLALGARVAAGAEPPVLGPAAAPFDGVGLSARATGRLFFTISGRPRSCTASVVNAVRSLSDASVIITAGHCLLSDGSDGPRTPAANIVFVPGYRAGAEPYGRYLAEAVQVTSGWAQEADWSNDVGFVRLASQMSLGLHTEVGGYGMVFEAPPALGRVDLLGYPTTAPFDGSAARICRGTVTGASGAADPADPGSQPLPCEMTAGYSGGPGLAAPAVEGILTDPADLPANPGAAGSYIVGIGSHDYRRGTVYLAPLGEQALAALREVVP